MAKAVAKKNANIPKSSTLKRSYENDLLKKGCFRVIGIDEAGRGPLAGPVVTSACYIPPGLEIRIPEINDSKQIDEHGRESIYSKLITSPGVVYAYEVIDEVAIDTLNILNATKLGMSRCIYRVSKYLYENKDKEITACINTNELNIKPLDDIELNLANDLFPLLNENENKNKEIDKNTIGALIDGSQKPNILENRKNILLLPIIKGDGIEYNIAAASIIAKVERDRIMAKLHIKYPEWNFDTNKGYPILSHRNLLKDKKPIDIHRWSYTPVLESLIKYKYIPKNAIDKEYKNVVMKLRKQIRELELDQLNDNGKLFSLIENEINNYIKENKNDKKYNKIKKKSLKEDIEEESIIEIEVGNKNNTNKIIKEKKEKIINKTIEVLDGNLEEKYITNHCVKKSIEINDQNKTSQRRGRPTKFTNNDIELMTQKMENKENEIIKERKEQENEVSKKRGRPKSIIEIKEKLVQEIESQVSIKRGRPITVSKPIVTKDIVLDITPNVISSMDHNVEKENKRVIKKKIILTDENEIIIEKKIDGIEKNEGRRRKGRPKTVKLN